MAALGRPCGAQALSSCGERGLLLVVAHRPLVAVLLFCGAWMLGPQWLQLSGSSTWAQELWDPGSVALWHTGSSRTEDGTPCPLHWQAALNPYIHKFTVLLPTSPAEFSVPIFSSLGECYLAYTSQSEGLEVRHASYPEDISEPDHGPFSPVRPLRGACLGCGVA